ncbi:MAG: amidohydrolase family protein [Brevundimonas sp.]
MGVRLQRVGRPGIGRLKIGWLGAGLGLAGALLASGESATAAPSDLVIRGARLLDAASEPVEAGYLRVVDGLIAEAGPDRPGTSDETALDGAGLTILPGFWNAHVHLTTPEYLRATALDDAALERELARTFTRWGFTTVFDLASTTAISHHVATRTEQGVVAGPRVLSVAEPFYPAGGTPVYARPFYEAFDLPSAEVADAQSAVGRAQTQLEAGADGLKLFTGAIVGEAETLHMSAAIVSALTALAQARGASTFAHPTDAEGLNLAVDHGVRVLAHAAPLAGEWSPGFAHRLASRQVAMTPTLSLFALQPHALTPVEVAVQQTRALHEVGGLILFGTDAGFVDEFDTTLELVLLEQAIGWSGVVAALTSNPVHVFGDPEREGRLAVGYRADLTIVGCDPRQDIRCLADVRLVIRGGEVIYRQDSSDASDQGPRPDGA